MPVKDYDEYYNQVLKNFKKIFPEEKQFSVVFAEWLLDRHCILLEKYDLCRNMKDGGGR